MKCVFRISQFLIFTTFFFISVTNHVFAITYNVQPTILNSNSITINWETDTAQNSKIEYGTTDSYGTSATNASSTTSHSITITGLITGTTYHYRVGNISGTDQSNDFTVTIPYDFGILTNSAGSAGSNSHNTDEYEKGIRIKTLDLAWDQYETSNGTWNASFITTKQNEMEAYIDAGFQIVLDLGTHYTPSWVTSLDSHALFKNQYGDTYAPASPGKNVANVVFNDTVRNELSSYIQKVFADFGTDFYGVRAGGLWYGELHYPEDEYNGRINSFWGYDDNAQGDSDNLPTGVSENPVPGWIPNPVDNGTFEAGTDGNWILGGAMDTIVASDGHRGSYSLKMENPGAFSNVVQQDVPVVSGRTYRYSVWAKTSDNDTSTPPCLQITTTGGVEIVSPQCAFSTTYQQITGTFTPNVNTVRINLLTYASEPGVTLTFDDVSLFDSNYSYDATNANATSFWNWYRNSLINYQNWQIDEYRDAGYAGNIYMLYPGYGIRTLADTNWVTQSISYDLSNTSIGNTSGSMGASEDWGSQIAGLSGSDTKITAYTTWIDGTGTDASSNKADWSAAKYLADIADTNNRNLSGENTGANNYTEMQTAFSNITSYGYSGIFWFDQTQLYGGTYATSNNFATEISNLDETAPYNGSLSINSGSSATTSQSVTLTISARDNVTPQSELQMQISNSEDFSGTSYETFSSSKQWALASANGIQNVYIRFRDSVGNVSNTIQSNITVNSSPSNNSSNSSNSSTTTSSSTCSSNIPPSTTPNLFQIDTSKDSATLYFAPSGAPVSFYNVYYGLENNQEQYSTRINYGQSSGAISYTINSLAPNTTYYFKVQGGNGCVTTDWSQIVKATTSSKTVSFYPSLGSTIYTTVSNFVRQLTPVTNSASNQPIIPTTQQRQPTTPSVITPKVQNINSTPPKEQKQESFWDKLVNIFNNSFFGSNTK